MIGIGSSLLFDRRTGKAGSPEPDVYYDLSLKDNSSPTRNIIDDLSGNGRDAEIFNAAYTESSGYRADGALSGSRFLFFLFYCILKNGVIFKVRVNYLIITYHFLLFPKNKMSLKERLC